MAGNKILCVAEKPSIAKAVAEILGGGRFTTVFMPFHTQMYIVWTYVLTPSQHNVSGATFNKNYEFDFDFGGQWGRCQVVMTSVLGHLTESDFGPGYRDWKHPPPERLFDAPIIHGVAKVSNPSFQNQEGKGVEGGRRVESPSSRGKTLKGKC